MIDFQADKLKISGPRVDGSFVVSFETGEYEQEKVAELLRLPQQSTLNVKVVLDNENKNK